MTFEESFYNEKEILIIGGTGSLGKTLTYRLKQLPNIRGIRLFSRDEEKQWRFRNELEAAGLLGNVSFLIGDVRDYRRLCQAMRGVDIVINTAAMKQVGACEFNALEAIKTNIDGATNVIDACIASRVKTCLHISTDKAVYPVNLYGMSKATAERLFVNANYYDGFHEPAFGCVRYGNVLNSRGSILPLFVEQYKRDGVITLTDDRMTRFFIRLCDVVDFILTTIPMVTTCPGGIFIPKMKSSTVDNFIHYIFNPIPQIKSIGIREGEKLHETIIGEEEAEFTRDIGDRYQINPFLFSRGPRWSLNSHIADRLSGEEIRHMVANDMEKEGLKWW